MTIASVVSPVTQFFDPSVLFSMGTLVPPVIKRSMRSISTRTKNGNSSAGRGGGNIINEFILSQSALYIDQYGVLTFEDPDISQSEVFTSATFKIPLNTATHIAFVKNNTVGSFYLNGVLSLQIQGMKSTGYGGAFLCFGQDYLVNSSFYRGYQDSILVSNTALKVGQTGNLIRNIIQLLILKVT